MVKMCRQSMALKDTQFGLDMMDILIEKQLKDVAFRELDVLQSIVTLKEHLVKKFAPRNGENPSELRFLYPTYFDSARVLIAEYVVEFLQTGKMMFSELDVDRWEYIDHEIRQISITEKELDTLLWVLCKTQNPAHDLCARWPTEAAQMRWVRHLQGIELVISTLK